MRGEGVKKGQKKIQRLLWTAPVLKIAPKIYSKCQWFESALFKLAHSEIKDLGFVRSKLKSKDSS